MIAFNQSCIVIENLKTALERERLFVIIVRFVFIGSLLDHQMIALILNVLLFVQKLEMVSACYLLFSCLIDYPNLPCCLLGLISIGLLG